VKQSVDNVCHRVIVRLIDRKGIFFVTTLGLIGLMFALVWLGNVPSANAQGRVQGFKGKVVLDGRPAPDGTRVTAYIDGLRISRSERTRRGRFEIEVHQRPSITGKTVEFIGRTVDGRELRFSQNARLLSDGVTTIDLKLRGVSSFPFAEAEEVHVFQGTVVINGQPTSDETRVSALINQVQVSGARTKAGRFQLNVRQPVSNSGMNVEIWVRGEDRLNLRFPETWPWQPGGFTEVAIQFGGSVPGDASARLEQERARLEQERALQQEQQALQQERIEAERRLQEEQARLDQERIEQEQGLFQQEQRLAEQQQKVEQDRMARQRQQEERLRREVELNLQRQQFELEQRTRLERGLPPLPPEKFAPSEEPENQGPRRGFFTNTTVGGLGTANDLMDPTMLALIGIVLTLGATMLQMIRGN